MGMKKSQARQRSEPGLKRYTLNEHFQELKIRFVKLILTVITAVILIFPFCWDIIGFLAAPLIKLQVENSNFKFIYTKLTEAFITECKVAIVFGIFFSLPVIFYQIYMFLAPGLYKNERRAVVPYLFFSPLLFLLGLILVYCVVMPISWRFFLSFQDNNVIMPLNLEAKISEYIELVTELFLAFGLAFQLPIITNLLVKFQLVSINSLCRARRYVIVLIFILAAILTPPDVISQIFLALPLILLYEVSIFFCKRIKNAQG
jgi:sec-independent protein translocase protein TatC